MFSKRLKQLREEKGITQLELANILGITPQNISYYEKGREPNYEILSKLADYFGVTTDYLFGRTGYKINIDDEIDEKKMKLTELQEKISKIKQHLKAIEEVLK